MEIKKQESTELSVESPLTGGEESFGELEPGEQTPEMSDQEAASQGGAGNQQREDDIKPDEDLGPSAGEAPEGTVPELYSDDTQVPAENPDIANATTEEPQSFWGGSFGKPRIPVLGE